MLLTRDPEGLALALAKIGAASGKLVGSESIAHLYVVDPTGGASPLHRVFPTHPSLEDRIGELARLGSGIEPGALERTMAAGAAFRLRFPEGETASESPECPANAEPSGHDAAWVDAAPVGEQKEADTSALVPIYERPDGWSTVVEWVPPGSPVRHLDESVGNFVRVETRNGTCGWASKLARLAADREPQG